MLRPHLGSTKPSLDRTGMASPLRALKSRPKAAFILSGHDRRKQVLKCPEPIRPALPSFMMGGMPLRFGTRGLFLATTFVAICAGSFVAAWKLLAPVQQQYLVPTVAFVSPFWLPTLFVAYALGRKAITASI